MNKWSVLLSDSAKKGFYAAEKKMQGRLRKAFTELARDPFSSRPNADIKQLRGSANPIFYRMRVGDYRVVYSVQNGEVRITRIFPRKKGYEWI